MEKYILILTVFIICNSSTLKSNISDENQIQTIQETVSKDDSSATLELIAELIDMTRSDIIKKLGNNYKTVLAGAEGCYEGLFYENMDIKIVFDTNEDTCEVAWIECGNSVNIKGALNGMSFKQVMEYLGNAAVNETFYEEPSNKAYLLTYKVNGCKIVYMSFNKDGTDGGFSIFSSNDMDFSEIGFELMKNESVGFLKIGLLDIDVIKNLGNPEEKTEIETWGADGENHQTWKYVNKGIEVDMVGDLENQVVNRIYITRPCDFKTSRNIGLGSRREDVLKEYNNEINNEESGLESSSLVAGTVYGGVIFEFENDFVSSIIIGAIAE